MSGSVRGLGLYPRGLGTSILATGRGALLYKAICEVPDFSHSPKVKNCQNPDYRKIFWPLGLPWLQQLSHFQGIILVGDTSTFWSIILVRDISAFRSIILVWDTLSFWGIILDGDTSTFWSIILVGDISAFRSIILVWDTLSFWGIILAGDISAFLLVRLLGQCFSNGCTGWCTLCQLLWIHWILVPNLLIV